MFHNTHLTRERHQFIMSSRSTPTSPSGPAQPLASSKSDAPATSDTAAPSSLRRQASPSSQASLQQPIRAQSPAQNGFFSDLLAGKTPAVKGIEQAYSRAGAGNNSTPGHASKLGSQAQTSANGYQGQGVGSSKFAEKYQDSRHEVS